MNTVLGKKINRYAFLLWAIIYTVIQAVFLYLIFNLNIMYSLVGSVVLLVFLVGTIIIFLYKKKYRMVREVELYFESSSIQRSIVENIDIPYIIIDKSGDILWKNKAFNEKIASDKQKLKNISEFFNSNININEIIEKNIDIKPFEINDNYYTAKIINIKIKLSNDENLYGIYIFDNTEIVKMRKQILDEKLIQGIIYVDNYEDAMHDIDDIRKSLMTSLLDRRIRKYFNEINSVIQKYDKDKYYILLQNKNLNRLQSDKFGLLEDIKKLNVGNDIALTLSMGFSESNTSYQDGYEQAVSAVDMALARGGDQVVVKRGEKTYYYGGRAKSVEKNTRVKSRVKAHALKSVFENRDKIMIMGHKLPDIDCVGAGIGVYKLAKLLDKEAHIVITDLISSVRTSVNKFIEDKSYPDDMFISADRAKELIDRNTTLVIVDVNKPAYTEVPELIEMAGQVVVIDHHRQGSDVVKNPVLAYIETSASSTSEMITEVLQYFNDKNLKIEQKIVDALYAGILIDTNYFANRVGVRTFEAAAFLRKNGADLDGIRKMLRDGPERIKAKASIITDAYIFREGFIIGSFDGNNIDSPTELGAQAANELLNIDGIKASVVLTKIDNTIYVSFRSIDEINVQLIAEHMGGGGHQTIAGVQLKNFDLDEAKNEVIYNVNKMLDEGDI